ncbi:MAG: hypothetical protein IJU60_05080 [Acholeplasmatales bacterium]|nr:hypothetical protein [Acholeplasmatales bacterium]
MKKYIKNLYQILSIAVSYALVEVLLLIPFIPMSQVERSQQEIKIAYALILSGMIGLPVLTIIFGCFWIFQFVSFDESGIKIFFMNHIIKEIKWKDVKRIEYSNWMKNPTITLHLLNGDRINLDRREKIISAINKYLHK